MFALCSNNVTQKKIKVLSCIFSGGCGRGQVRRQRTVTINPCITGEGKRHENRSTLEPQTHVCMRTLRNCYKQDTGSGGPAFSASN